MLRKRSSLKKRSSLWTWAGTPSIKMTSSRKRDSFMQQQLLEDDNLLEEYQLFGTFLPVKIFENPSSPKD